MSGKPTPERLAQQIRDYDELCIRSPKLDRERVLGRIVAQNTSVILDALTAAQQQGQAVALTTVRFLDGGVVQMDRSDYNNLITSPPSAPVGECPDCTNGQQCDSCSRGEWASLEPVVPAGVEARAFALWHPERKEYGNVIVGDPSLLREDYKEHGYVIVALAQQPEVRDVAEYQYRCPKASDPGWRRMTKGEYDATLATGHACGNPGWTRDVEVRALYTAPPPADAAYDRELIAEMLEQYRDSHEDGPGAFLAESIDAQIEMLRAADNASASAETVSRKPADAEVRAPEYTTAMGEAADRYIRSLCAMGDGTYALRPPAFPGTFRWEELYQAMLAATEGVQAGEVECDCPGKGKDDPALHAPNCPARLSQQSEARGVVDAEKLAHLVREWELHDKTFGHDGRHPLIADFRALLPPALTEARNVR